MRYLGGKSRIAKDITDILRIQRMRMVEETGKEVPYWEPFLGAAWTMVRMTGMDPNYGSDAHYELMVLWNALQKGWIPPSEITEEEHRIARVDKDFFEPHKRGFIGFCGSFGGMWFHGYARSHKTKRNFADEASRGLLKKIEKMRNVTFYQADFLKTSPPRPHCLIYCDPPYAGTTGYDGTPKFDSNKFWDKVRLLSNSGHTVYVSEYNAPEDFECVWEKKLKSDLKGDFTTSNTRHEKLFTYKKKGDNK